MRESSAAANRAPATRPTTAIEMAPAEERPQASAAFRAGAGGETTSMVHGRVRRPSRQALEKFWRRTLIGMKQAAAPC